MAEPITIEVTGDNAFTVRQGDRFADGLCWDEMLAVVASVTMTAKTQVRLNDWLKTQEQHDRRAAFLENMRARRDSQPLVVEADKST
jgi:hypothetical protein